MNFPRMLTSRIKALVAVAVISGCSAVPTMAKEDFMSFRVKPFGREDAERLASEKFEKLYGACGAVIFKERRFEAWVFETRIGYAGTKGPDITVFSSAPSSISDILESARRRTPNQSSEPMRMSVTCRADARPAPATRVAHL
jgi:hypothetical protein